MAWYQVSLSCRAGTAEKIAGIMESMGALAVTLSEPAAAAASPDVLEPAPGSTPLWTRTEVRGLFPPHAGTVRALRERLSGLADEGAGVRTEVLEERDWVSESRRGVVPACFGNGLWVVPEGYPPPEAARAVVCLEPGVSFGTGAHPTTRLCLEWLAGTALAGRRVVDYGCGSGILGIAAARLGAREVVLVDLDPQALESARENAQRNRVAEIVRTFEPDRLPGVPAIRSDVVVSNILLEPLVGLAPRLAGLLVAGGRLCLAGILAEQAAALRSAYRPWIALRSSASLGGWSRLEGECR